MVEHLWQSPDIFRILVPLPDNPLKYLNVYVIRGPVHSLIIDTGFNREECRKALWNGLEELKLDFATSSLFLTHLHADHTGLVWDFVERGIPIYMGQEDKKYFDRLAGELIEDQILPDYAKEGFPTDQLALQLECNQGSVYAPAPGFPVITVDDGQELYVDEYVLRAICTPGHTPGHMVLYLPKEQLLFSGDHILFDITPNIITWPEVPHSLSDYVASLQKMRALPIQAAFPAHREAGVDVYQRIDELIEHHGRRLDEIYQTVRTHPGCTAYETAGMIQWSMRGLSWAEFPPSQRWFAMGETLAHLAYLTDNHQLFRKLDDDIIRYYPALG